MKTRKSIVTMLFVAICAMTITMFAWGGVQAAEVICVLAVCENELSEDATDESGPITVIGNDLMADDGCVAGEDQAFIQGPAESKYTVTYMDWDNNMLMRIRLRDGQIVEELYNLRLSREGYTFEYWSDISDQDMTPYVFGHSITGDLTLIAYYSPAPDEEEGLSPLEIKEINDCASSIIESIVSLGKCETEGLRVSEISGCAKAILEDIDCLGTCGTDAAPEVDEGDIVPSDQGETTRPIRSVKIHSSAGALVNEHDLVTLRGELSGLDGCVYTLQWQVLNDGQWQNINGANGIEHCYFATAESIYCKYRLCVAIIG